MGTDKPLSDAERNELDRLRRLYTTTGLTGREYTRFKNLLDRDFVRAIQDAEGDKARQRAIVEEWIDE